MGGLGIGQINNYAAGGATTLFGLHQYFEGKKMEKGNKRPTYEIPPEIQQNLTASQHAALQGLPEEQKRQYLSNLQRSGAYALSQSSSRKGGLAGVASVNDQQNQGYSNLLSQDAGARMENQKAVYGMRQNMADYKDQAFQFNRVDPFYELQARAEAMKGAGIQNIGNSFQIAGGGQGSGGTGTVQQQAPNRQYVDPNQGSKMNYQTNLNQNQYYNPYGQGSQSGTMVNDNPYQMGNIG